MTTTDDSIASEQYSLPIREVTRLTGVNPVTLRAWERRYGLIQPQRTASGHRLYSDNHIVRIREVLSWLERGVAVGQVKRLLPDVSLPQAPNCPLWEQQKQLWLNCIEQLAELTLDDEFEQARNLYTAETLCRELLQPLLEELQRLHVQSQARVEQVFFLSWLRRKLSALIHHSNSQHTQAPLLFISLSEQAMQPGLWLCAWLASESGYPIRVLDWPIPTADIGMAIRLIEPCAVLFYCDQRLAPNYLQHIPDDSTCPQLLCGQATNIHRDTLSKRPLLHLADTPMSALHCLKRLNLTAGS